MGDTKKYNQMSEHPPLRDFAYIGTREQFLHKCKYLASIADDESWAYDDPKHHDDLSREFGVLHQYIHHTFSKALEDNLIVKTETHAIMNTGLLSSRGQQIYMLFEENKYKTMYGPQWYFKSFYFESAHEIPANMRSSLPPYVDYFKNNPELMYFDVSLKIIGNVEHIIKDNIHRLPKSLQELDQGIIDMIISSAQELMKKRIQRNNRLVVPQYYNKKIMYLFPLRFGNDYIPLAVERHEDTYRINTVLTKGMAYCNARLLMKPESNWLTNE